MRVRGIVTAEPGPILDDRTFAIQDATAGIMVRLDGARKDVDLPRGTEVVVEGRLTARYGALEVRLDGDDPLEVHGLGELPDAQVIQVVELGEATEGRLVLASGMVVDVDRAKSGTTTVILEDASGRGRIVGFAGAGALPDGLGRGAAAVVTGIAGQRASANGRLDGYRIWIRDGSDIEIAQSATTPSPRPSADPSAAPTPTLVAIALARSRSGQNVTVEGTVTSQARLLDADGRRVTIQDPTGGILLRVAVREAPPPVGSRVRVAGSIGTYYGAPQLSATAPVERLGSAAASPTRLTSAPRDNAEWQLVRVAGTVADVKRTGQSWRAELVLAGGARIPIVGLARAAIPADRIREGQHGAIVGIVRRAHPTATDRRFAVLPRGRADLDLAGAATAAEPAGQEAGAGRSTTGDSSASGSSSTPSTDDQRALPAISELRELQTSVGRVVRVGGLVAGMIVSRVPGIGPTLVLRDDSGRAGVRLPVGAAAMAAALAPGDLVEAIGSVVRLDEGRAMVVVGDPADVLVAGQATDRLPGPRPRVTSDGKATEALTAGDGLDLSDSGQGTSGDDATPIAPLMGAAGAGLVLTGVLAVGAAWRRRLARHRASVDATKRLNELLSVVQEPRVNS